MRRALCAVAAALGLALLTAGPAAAGPPPAGARPALPVFAHYYLWFDPSSWDRAKLDTPAQGRYSSDDVAVMREQVRQAMAAGITGFIVSWKSTEVNNRRLRHLVQIAREQGFHLAITYQGLDFDRNPLPIARVARDLQYFHDAFAPDPVFHLMDKPLLIWSGTWMFSPEDVAAAAGPIRPDVTVLASEKSADGYRRIAASVDGDAYYWSSVDPTTDTHFADRLQQIGTAVHDDGGLWFAPFAPGFNAQLIGGQRDVDRRDGATLRAEYAAAVASAPDALALISWNEFTENTYVEPSRTYGTRYLDVLRDLTGSAAPALGEQAQDSSGPGDEPDGVGAAVVAAASTAGIVGGGTVVILMARRRRASRAPVDGDAPEPVAVGASRPGWLP